MTQIPIFDTVSGCAEDTSNAGARLANLLLAGSALPRFVALDGDLGAGKTEFARGFIGVFCPGVSVRSPTYAIVNEYLTGKLPVFHFDVYRIKDDDDLYSTGFYGYPERGICLVEWCELIPYAVPDDYISVIIEKCSDGPDRRVIRIIRVNKKQ